MGPWTSYFSVFTSAGSKEAKCLLHWDCKHCKGRGGRGRWDPPSWVLCNNLGTILPGQRCCHYTSGLWRVEMELVEDISRKMGFQRKNRKILSPLSGHTTTPASLPPLQKEKASEGIGIFPSSFSNFRLRVFSIRRSFL